MLCVNTANEFGIRFGVSLNKSKLQKWYGANIERNLQAILEPFPP